VYARPKSWKKKKRFELTFETVLVALFTERFGQRVPDRRTSNIKGPTAECRPSVARYVHQLSSCRTKMLSARDIGDGRPCNAWLLLSVNSTKLIVRKLNSYTQQIRTPGGKKQAVSTPKTNRDFRTIGTIKSYFLWVISRNY